ncbi:MAG: type II toxin-antitoxin system RelE/ParE family toxin [Candidatus Margulisiibacteriota bacterium]
MSRSAEKFLSKLPQNFQDHFFNKIFGLSLNPRPVNCKKLRGSGFYRIRTGNYRIIYSIDDTKKKIIILDIGHRKDIYR